jgi:hypothetical protein|tara:strand:- start:1708 stop:2037 length:330 start_codon:yes stop_codon:yes gene_type:complete
MSPKKLQLDSKYAQYDLDRDGVVSDSEIERAKEMIDLELREEKSEAQKLMAWLAILVMTATTIILFTPIIPDSRVNALSDLLGLFYFSMCGIVGTYMGATAFMHKPPAK